MATGMSISDAWWTTNQVRPIDVSDAWEDALSDCYLSWGVKRRVERDFSAQIRQRNFDRIRLVQCVCSPCAGHRSLQHIQRDNVPHLGIQIISKGVERFLIGGEWVSVGSGALIIWNSCQSAEFEVVETLHKSTLMIPLAVIEDRLPRGACIRGGIIDSQSGIGALLFSQIRVLTEQFTSLSEADASAAKWSTIELAATAAARLDTMGHQTLADYHLQRVQNYVLDNLHDGELSVEKIANANRISVRYVHKLFSLSNRSVSRWILEQRLERCREALRTKLDSRCVVKEVAFRWGFNDTAHFSRVFKQRFGLSPLDYWLSVHSSRRPAN